MSLKAWSAVRVLLCCLVAGMAHAAGLAGTYENDELGVTMTLRLSVQGSVVTGSLEGRGQVAATLEGRVRGDGALGRAVSGGGEGSFEVRARPDGVRLVLSQPEGPAQQAGSVTLEFRRAGGSGAPSGAGAAGAPSAVSPAPAGPDSAGGDGRLVGEWRWQEVIVSGDASMAMEEVLVFRADGEVIHARGRSTAGGGDWSWDGGAGGPAQRGRWRTSDGVLYVAEAGGRWTRLGRYGMTEDGRTLRIISDQGARRLWSRR